EWTPAASTDRVEEAISSLFETQPRQVARQSGSWLIFADGDGVGQRLADLLAARGQSPILVFPGKDYRRINESRFQISPESPLDMHKLTEALRADNPVCLGVIHLWSLEATPPESLTRAALESAQDLGCLSALRLVQELDKIEWADSPRLWPRLWLVTRGAQ